MTIIEIQQTEPVSVPVPVLHWVMWSDDHYEELKACWSSGMSAERTANSINHKFGTNYSRNSIIGKVNRHGLSVAFGRVRAQPTQKAPRAPRSPSLARVRLAIANIPDIEDSAIPFEQRKTLMTLERGECHWPVGDPASSEFFFCGGVAKEGKSYCAGHCKRAFGYTREAKSTFRRPSHLLMQVVAA